MSLTRTRRGSRSARGRGKECVPVASHWSQAGRATYTDVSIYQFRLYDVRRSLAGIQRQAGPALDAYGVDNTIRFGTCRRSGGGQARLRSDRHRAAGGVNMFRYLTYNRSGLLDWAASGDGAYVSIICQTASSTSSQQRCRRGSFGTSSAA